MNEAVENIGARRLADGDGETARGRQLRGGGPQRRDAVVDRGLRRAGSSPASPRTPILAATCCNRESRLSGTSNGLPTGVHPGAGLVVSLFQFQAGRSPMIFEVQLFWRPRLPSPCSSAAMRADDAAGIDDDHDHANSAGNDGNRLRPRPRRRRRRPADDHDASRRRLRPRPLKRSRATHRRSRQRRRLRPRRPRRRSGDRWRPRPTSRPDVEVYDQTGALVGKVDSVSAKGAIVNTGKARAEIPLASFGKNDKGLVVSDAPRPDIDSQGQGKESRRNRRSSLFRADLPVAPGEALHEGRPEARLHAGDPQATGRPAVAGLERV